MELKNKHPRLSKFIKKLNRGLVLALVIVLAMTVWLTASAIRLRRETPALRAMTREYLTELVEVNALMNGETVGKEISNETAEAMKDAMSGIVDKYHSISRAAQRACNLYSSRKSGPQLIDELSSWTIGAKALHINSFEITELETVTNNGRVMYNYSFEPKAKAGKYLEVWFSFEAQVEYETIDPSTFEAFPFNTKIYYEIYGDKYFDAYGEPTDGGVYLVDATIQISGRIVFVRENGEWRIACVQNMSAGQMSTTKTPILTKEVG